MHKNTMTIMIEHNATTTYHIMNVVHRKIERKSHIKSVKCQDTSEHVP